MTAPADAIAPATDHRRRRASDWWYLGFLSMLAFQPIFDPSAGAFEWAVTGAVVAMFVPLYLAFELRPGPWRRWAAPAAALLGVVVFPVNSGATVLLVYAAGFAAAHEPRRNAFRWFTALSLICVALAAFAPLPMPFALAAFAVPTLFVWVVGIAVLEEEQREHENETLRIDNARIEHLATATERERIARDLHDLIGHSLTSIIVRAQLVQQLVATDASRASDEATEIERVARSVLTEIRATVSGWRQVVFDDELTIAHDTLATVGVTLTVGREPDLALTPSVEQVLGLALREAVTNVVRHAHARRCVVTLRHHEGELVLEIADDGVGGGGEGNGLAGMRERMVALGGHVERHADGGTRLTIAVPRNVAG